MLVTSAWSRMPSITLGSVMNATIFGKVAP